MAYLRDVCEHVVFAPTNIAVKKISEYSVGFNDKTPWGFLSYYRDPTFVLDHSRDNFTLSKFGDALGWIKDPDTGKYYQTVVQSIPINLNYVVDAWAATNRRVQELGIAIVSKLTMQDTVFFAPVEPNGKNARFHIQDVEWVDNSDIEAEDSHGRIYRHTVSFTIIANLTLTTKVRRDPFLYTDLPIEIYEGDDIDGQECTQCDFEILSSKSRDPNESTDGD